MLDHNQLLALDLSHNLHKINLEIIKLVVNHLVN